MSELNRRNFIAATAGTATSLAALGKTVHAAVQSPRPPQVPLGNTGITMSRVGQGTGVHGGRRQSNQTRMGFEKLVALMRHAYDRGITFFDLADLYGTHIYFREALRSIPREKITVLSKVWWRYDGNPQGWDPKSLKKIATATLERLRHEVSTDYIDIVLLHCMSTHKWDKELRPYMDALMEAKDKKQIRAVGVSCHDFGAMETAVTCPWVDVVLARINPGGVKMDGTPEEVTGVLRRLKQNGKAVIGMKIFGEGQLAGRKEECVRFAQNLGLLDAMTIGFEKPEQIDDMLALIHKYPAAKVGV